MAMVAGIFIGILFFGNASTITGLGSAGAPPQELLYVSSTTGLLRGSKLRNHWNSKADKFKEYLHHKHELGVAATNSENRMAHSQSVSSAYPHMGLAPPKNYNIKASWKPPGGKRFEEYKDGTSPYPITDQIKQQSDDLARIRREYVKIAMEVTWEGYETYAFGMDEILPISRRGTNNWGGFAVTMVDSMDTLWLLGMRDEFSRARDYVKNVLNYDKGVRAVSFFETTIRSVGGLLSAYDWSGDTLFLDSALELGRRLIRAFDDSDTGTPFGQVNLQTGKSSNVPWAGNNAILAEFGTVQLEYRWLDAYINTPETAEMRRKVEHIYDVLYDMRTPNGLFPYYMDMTIQQTSSTLAFANNHYTFGAMADSFYEYLLKTWIQGGKVENKYREMYDSAMQGMHDELLHFSVPSGLAYIADKNGEIVDHKMDHLVCFMGGLLGLGAYTDPLGLDSERAQRDLKTGRALAYTCYQMYARMNTGISPEYVQFVNGDDLRIGAGASHYLLRPEAIESFFILNYLTGDPIYREWGWEIFQSVEKYCRAGVGYGTLKDVSNTNLSPDDKTETFWIAETLVRFNLLC